MSSHLHIPFLSIGSRRRLVVALVVTLLALLSLASSRVHAQENKLPNHPWHAVGGIGRVEVVEVDAPGISCPSNSTRGTTSGLSLTLDEGGTARYCLRLTKQPVPVPPLARIMREGVVLGETQEPPCGTNVVSTNI